MMRCTFQAAWLSGRNLLLGQNAPLPLYNFDQIRMTSILERVVPVKLFKKGRVPKVADKNKVVRLVERVHSKPTPDITCILTDSVDGLGIRGDQVSVKRSLFRSRLLPGGLAVYASPENVEAFAKEKAETGLTEAKNKLGIFAEMTLKQLSCLYLKIPMSGDNPWILTKTHVRVALRRTGVELKEECITLPTEEITEPKEFTFQITVNGVKSIDVKGRILLRHRDPSKDEILQLPPNWLPSVRALRKAKKFELQNKKDLN